MNLFQKKFDRIKNVQTFRLRKDFAFNPISFFLFALFIGGGIALQYSTSQADSITVIQLGVLLVVIASLVALVPLWITLINGIILLWLVIFGAFDSSYWIIGVMGTVGLILSTSIQLILQWDKVVILRHRQIQDRSRSGYHLHHPPHRPYSRVRRHEDQGH